MYYITAKRMYIEKNSEENMKRVTDMTVGNPMKLLLTFAVPLIITNIGQQFYMIVDSAIVGHGVGVKALASVGATDWSYWMVLWTIQSTVQGFSTFVANYFGQKDYEKLNKVIAMSMELCAVLGIVISVGGPFVVKPLLRLLQTPEDIYQGAVLYLGTLIAGTVIVIAYNMASAILRAFGNGRTPLIAMCIAAVVNICLDVLFVLILHRGILGAALATLIAQLVSFLFCVHEIRKVDCVQLKRETFSPDFEMIGKLCRFSLPLAFQHILIGGSGMFLQSSVNLQGSMFVAGYTAYNKIFGLMESSALSLGFASTTYTAQNWGAKNKERLKKGARDSVLAAVIIAVVLFLVIQIASEPMLNVFIDHTEASAETAMKVGKHFLQVMSWFMIVLYVLDIFRALAQGMENSVYSMVSGIIESVVRVTTSKCFLLLIGTEILFYVEPLSWCGAMVVIIWGYIRIWKKAFKTK